MKRSLLFSAVIVSVLISLLGAAVVPVAAAGGEKSITLLGVEYIPGKGVVFVFDVKGNFDKQGFSGSVMIGRQKFNLTGCTIRENGSLACVGEKGLSKYVGNIANATVNGFSSSGIIRTKYCYPVYDWNTSFVWGEIGTHCQKTEVNVGDSINYYNPYWDDNLKHYALPDGLSCFQSGLGYYFPNCPWFPQ